MKHSKTAIVTGGSRGIGLAIVHELIHDGFNVLTCGRGDRPNELSANAIWKTADVASAADAKSLVELAQKQFGSIELLVNNAGVQVEKSLLDSTEDDWDLIVGVNCRGVFNMSQACLEHMQHHGGNIINIGSISGNRSIAVDHGPNVRCNAIQPGWIMTAMADDAFGLAKEPLKAKEDALARHPVGRFGTPEDIANMVSFLASDKSRYISGECITVDGGMTAASPLRPGLF